MTQTVHVCCAGVLLDSAMDVAGRQAGAKRKRAAAIDAAAASPPISTKKPAAAGTIWLSQTHSILRQLHKALQAAVQLADSI